MVYDLWFQIRQLVRNQYVKDHLQFGCGWSASDPRGHYPRTCTLLHEQKQKKEYILYDRCPFPSLSACAQGG